MWNRELNKKHSDKLIEFCRDKKVLIMGNSISLFNEPRGNFIDSFDVVVRLGMGFPRTDFREYLGSKADVWFFTGFRANSYIHFKNTPFKIFNLIEKEFYSKISPPYMSVPYFFYSEDFQLYRDYFLMGNAGHVRNLIKTVCGGKFDKENRISQGAFAIAYFIHMIRSYSELHIYGFDFFESTVQYKLNNEINEISSFHLPIPTSKGKNSNPHTNLYGDSNKHYEKKYINDLRDQNKITIHRMNSIQQTPEFNERINKLIEKYRSGAVLVTEN